MYCLESKELLGVADRKIMEAASEILISSSLVTHDHFGDSYEFILSKKLEVMECVKIDALKDGKICPIESVSSTLEGLLFELNHVRVNPKVDNTDIIEYLTMALNDIGVEVLDPPEEESMAICFKPLGEISDNVRFYIGNNQKVVFLSPAVKPRLISTK